MNKQSQKKQKAKRFDGVAWYKRRMDRLTREAIREKNEVFARDNAASEEEQLLRYVRACAGELGHTPHRCELVGGDWIARRLGGWQEVCRRAGLPQPGAGVSLERTRLYRAEYARQAARHRKGRLVVSAPEKKRAC